MSNPRPVSFDLESNSLQYDSGAVRITINTTGPMGPQGISGINGSNGAQGPAGATGQTGVAGAAGLAGPIGPTGATGAQGAMGATGPSGLGPVGSVIMFAGLNAPTGYLECDGSAINRVTYSNLFTAIGTVWGAGDGITTFNLPSMARKTAIGRGGASTTTIGNTIGSIGGEETHVLTINELPPHNHSGNYYQSSPTAGTGVAYAPTNGASTVSSVPYQGGGASHNIMQPSAIFMFIIKT